MSLVRRAHLWFGLVTAVAVVAVSVTGILLNHRESLGLWNPPSGEQADLRDVQPINTLLRRALDAADAAGIALRGEGPRNVNRMLYRPGRDTAAVRIGDPRRTEVVVDGTTAAVLQVAARDDVSVEHVHSGEVVGQRGVILSDIAAGAVIVLAVGGVALWGRRLLRRRPAAGVGRTSRWLRVNVAVHLVAGLAVAAFALVLSVTGVLLNHKRGLGLMVEPVRILEAEDVAKAEPAPLAQLVGWARAAAPAADRGKDVRWVDYRPLAGYAKVRFEGAGELEVIVDVYEPRILSVARRHDVLVERIHSGAILGARATLLSDASAVLLVLLTLNGLYVWLAPAARTRTRILAAAERQPEPDGQRQPVGSPR